MRVRVYKPILLIFITDNRSEATASSTTDPISENSAFADNGRLPMSKDEATVDCEVTNKREKRKKSDPGIVYFYLPCNGCT